LGSRFRVSGFRVLVSAKKAGFFIDRQRFERSSALGSIEDGEQIVVELEFASGS